MKKKEKKMTKIMNNKERDLTQESLIKIAPPEKPVLTLFNGTSKANLPLQAYLDLYNQIVEDFDVTAVVENEFCKMTAKYVNGIVKFNLSCIDVDTREKQEESNFGLSFEKFETYALVVANRVDFTERLECDYTKYETVHILSVLVPSKLKKVKQITFNNGALWEYVCESRFLTAYQKFTCGMTDECKVNKDFKIYFFETDDTEVTAINYYCISEDRYISQHFISNSSIREYVETYVMKSTKEK